MMFSQILKTLAIAAVAFASICFAKANKGSEPYSFQRWKDHQVVAARNQVVRLTNRMHLLKTEKYQLDKDNSPLLDEADESLYAKLKTLGDDEAEEKEQVTKALLKSVDGKMQMAIENLQLAKELSLEDYLAVYLKQFSQKPEDLKAVAKKFSEEEIVQLIQSRLGQPETASN